MMQSAKAWRLKSVRAALSGNLWGCPTDADIRRDCGWLRASSHGHNLGSKAGTRLSLDISDNFIAYLDLGNNRT